MIFFGLFFVVFFVCQKIKRCAMSYFIVLVYKHTVVRHSVNQEKSFLEVWPDLTLKMSSSEVDLMRRFTLQTPLNIMAGIKNLYLETHFRPGPPYLESWNPRAVGYFLISKHQNRTKQPADFNITVPWQYYGFRT